ncbi:MAG TPA: alpha-1,4-glucan--maltose-1-phosphate maltosyltransferase [Jiangellaceae bacterium]|nr:alpha-1,4-glucan--maltose-1-phosphate maltosyltransferase [Jiangellaceae bacterium]
MIERVRPEVDAGRFPAKRVVGEACIVSADIFKDGHDQLAARVRYRGRGEGEWSYVAMPYDPDADRWAGAFLLDRIGEWRFTVEAWTDSFATWVSGLEKKVAAGQDVALELLEGGEIIERAARACKDRAVRASLTQAATTLRDTTAPVAERAREALDPGLLALITQHPSRDDLTEYSRQLLITVDRVRAAFAAWYEMFPRSQSGSPKRHGTFADAERQLPRIAQLGFDVVYLPPIHPIGDAFRKGKNNTLEPLPDDVGSPWAIGSKEGGHTAVHAQLGTLADFEHFVRRASELGLEVALDYALQTSPDHPWVREHPDWFRSRPDGTIQYAENPPKKYQDIYPLNFDNDPEGSYAEMLRIVRLWMDHGVRIFRVDNPHTKPVSFWHRLLAEVRQTDPDVVFLAEAFTKPAMMHTLAKIGFGQSYTYFTWKNSKQELYEYFSELRDAAAYMRPNAFVNTPDILHAYLQYGGPAAFKIRAVLAAMLSPTWGVYSGYELFEHVAVRPGSEEYLDSEKYQYRPRDWAAYEPGGPREGQSLAPYLTRLNVIRRAHPALHRLRNLRFHWVDNSEIVCFSKREPLPGGGEDVVVTVVNLDSHGTREGNISLDMPELGFDWHETFAAHDELTGQTFHWGQFDFVRLDPAVEPAHVLTIHRLGT